MMKTCPTQTSEHDVAVIDNGLQEAAADVMRIEALSGHYFVRTDSRV
jgi:hypothetical protein